MLEWELKTESKVLNADESDAFRKARATYFHAEKLQTLSLKKKSGVNWAIDSNENNRFFHCVVRGRLNKNSIYGLSVNGNWIEDPSSIKKVIFDHFKDQFSEPSVVRQRFASDKFKSISAEQVLALEIAFSEEEIKHVVWCCEGFKAPGPDGFSLNFVTKF